METELTIGGIKIKFPNKPYPSQLQLMSKIIKGFQSGQNCLLESPTGSGKTLALLVSALAWQKQEKVHVQNENAKLAYKIRNACYCDCATKKLKATSDSDSDSDDELNTWKIKKKNSDKKQKGHIQYEDEQETDKATNQCACLCHGMYSNGVVEKDSCDGNSDGPGGQGEEEFVKLKKVPTIFYCTRTHKQIANVVKELKKTVYGNDIKMTILSSRTHTCIHPQVSKMPSKDEGCKKLNKKGGSMADPDNTVDGGPSNLGGCSYLTRFKQRQPMPYENYGFKTPVWDIEDLMTSFKRKRYCPYYGARELMNRVDIVFCPYNYLIDPRIRSSMMINLNNQIIMIDEAHNCEDACRESTSFTFNKFQIDSGLRELRSIIAESFIIEPEIKDAFQYFILLFDKLIEWINQNCQVMTQQDFDTQMSRIQNGTEIAISFKNLGLDPAGYAEFKRHADKLKPEDPEKEMVSDSIRMLVNQIELMLEFIYMEENKFMDDFRLAITKTRFQEMSSQFNDEETTGAGWMHSQSTQQKSYAQKNDFNYTVNFWCLNPAVAFYYLKSCHSVILTSGTLSPMETFQSELGVRFDHQLEACHVISDKQVWVGSLGYGPTDVNLLTNYKTCETFAYQDELGRLILDVCKAIPYGVLCFLPSYTLLNKLWARWTESKLLDKIKVYKQVFNESRTAKNFDQLMTDYYECINKSKGGEKNNGALLVAVYRGRASEGLDFSDNYARAVIACGIPYPNVKDAQVDQKRKYNNTLCGKRNLLNGDEWYEIQAYRAVNQALGRCIRHRNDWGAIILVDDRYFKNPQKYAKGLSKWIRQRYKTYRNYKEAIDSLQTFSKEMIAYNGNFHPSTQSTQATPSQSQENQTSKDDIIEIETKTAELTTSTPSVKAPAIASIFNIGSKKQTTKTTSHIDYKKPMSTSSKASSNAPSSQKETETPGRKRARCSMSSSSTPKSQQTENLKEYERKKSSYFKPSSSDNEWKCINDHNLSNSSMHKTADPEQPKSSECSLVFDDDEEADFSYLRKKKKLAELPRSADLMDLLQPSMSEEEQFQIEHKGLNSFIKPDLHAKCWNCHNEFDFDITDEPEIKVGCLDDQLPKKIRKKLSKINGACIVLSDQQTSSLELKQSSGDKFILNSYIDESKQNCWQYFKCQSCQELVGVRLRFSQSNDLDFVSSFINKTIFFSTI